MRKLFLIFLFIFGAVTLQATDYDKEADAIKELFSQAISSYEAQDTDNARKLTQEAYFGHFEFLEGGIRINLGQKKAYAMEKQFGEIRKAIRDNKPQDLVEAMINNLLEEIDEILPLIKEGKKLVAQKSHDAGLEASGHISDVSNPWFKLYDEMDIGLKKALDGYEKGDKEAVIAGLNHAKFDIYRNKNLEIAIRQYIGLTMDKMIQQIIGNALSKNLELQKEAFEQHIKDVRDLTATAISKLPKESYALAPKDANDGATKVDYSIVVENINSKMGEVLALYVDGKVDQAISMAQDIYFDEYEDSGMEAKVGTIDSAMKLSTEASFSKIAALMKTGASKDQILAEQESLADKLDASVKKISNSSSPLMLFIYSLTIILREGFEALLIVAAVVAYLVKTGNEKRLNIVYSSLGIAVILSFATAYLVNLLFSNAGQSREILEGATMLVAVGLLFYVGFWLLSNAGAKKWSNYIKGEVAESLGKGDTLALWWTVFLAVYREGAETVLFYQVLIFDAHDAYSLGMVGVGFIIGIIVLILAFFIFKYFSIKIPIKPFFMFTSAIIFYMSIVFVGKGVMELVEGKVFVPTILHGFPTITWLGIYPYKESLIPQVILVTLLIVGIIIMKRKKLNHNKGE